MKSNYSLLALFVLLSFGLQGCLKDSCERTVSYIKLEPVFKTPDEIHNGTVVTEQPRELVKPGQIYYYNDHIFINELKEGIHVYDNSNPSNPVPVAFLAIPGNEDMAIRNGMLYVNTYIDLLVIDLQTYKAAGRTENVFPPLWEDIANNRIAVDYLEIPVTEVMDCATYSNLRSGGGILFGGEEDLVNFAVDNATGGVPSAPGAGTGGSMARFTVMGNYLYAIDESSMDLFDLSVPTDPVHSGEIHLGWGIETIFPYEDKLFIGSNSGMFIYDNSNPASPVQLAEFAHARACDPVFVKDEYAYVTLRSGNACDGFTNQLDLIDITQITNPILTRSFPMTNPHGLSIKGDDLFLCEGDAGLKVFDITDPLSLDQHLQDHEKGLHAFDVISLPGEQNILLVIGEDGFYQYGFDDPENLVLLSKIEIKK